MLRCIAKLTRGRVSTSMGWKTKFPEARLQPVRCFASNLIFGKINVTSIISNVIILLLSM